MKVGVGFPKMEYGVNVRVGVSEYARTSGSDVTVGVNVGVGGISIVAEGNSCNPFCVVVLIASVLAAGMAGIAQARLAANAIASAK